MCATPWYPHDDPDHQPTGAFAPGLSHAGVLTLVVPNAVSHRLAEAFQSLPSPYAHLEECLLELQLLATKLPRSFLQTLGEFRRNPQAPGVLRIQHLPVDSMLPPTPSDGERAMDKTTWLGEHSLLLIAQLLGDPCAYQNEKCGELVQNIVPIKSQAMSLSNAGSRADLLLHTEDVHLYPFHPDFVLLFCLRADRQREAATLVVDIREVLPQLAPTVIHTLRQPVYVVPPPDSFGQQGAVSAPLPVLRGPASMPEVTLQLNTMIPLTSAAQEALTALAAACQRVLTSVYAEPGELLCIHNAKVAHGRTAYTPHYDGYDRWLLRGFVKQNLFWPTREHCTPGSRRVLAF
jgi:L-asparagine oxygenase